ncbi:hypothetical protein [Nocardioides convexus]|uniref:hypothetical protein n=1 Tax=Nocardioides convexus TaxID=2712224 RepID=UPI002418203A|nr:hypothetical protein [Nocardioides convexus]
MREAIHAVFLFHAIEAGLDMGIVNAGALVPYDTIDPVLREAIEDVVLNRTDDSLAATERLLEPGRGPPGERRGRRGGRRGVALAARRRADHARAGQGHRRLRRGRHRGACARRSRPAAAGRSRSSRAR